VVDVVVEGLVVKDSKVLDIFKNKVDCDVLYFLVKYKEGSYRCIRRVDVAM